METIERKTLLYKSKVEYADYAINHAEGCAHGCKYPCYARLIKKLSYDEWIKPKLVENATDLLKKELQKGKVPQKSRVYLSFSTDPYMMGYPEVWQMTNNLIELLLLYGHVPVILTKGLIDFDTPFLRNGVEWGITLVSWSLKFATRFEPFAANPLLRWNRLARLAAKGENTWVSLEPYPPPTIFNQDIMDILNTVKFVKRIVFGRWNYAGIQEHEFYQKTAQVVQDFGKANRIEVIIKKEIKGNDE